MVTPVQEDTKLVTINIDGTEYEVPEGGNLVDMAKWFADNDIPVFCYHPKMDPVGMCRMCVVELGAISRDRATGDVQLDEDGAPVIRWFPKLQTACTQTVTDGMYVKTNTEIVNAGRESVLEFLLTSHPLDCPICDKGGECPLQNLTMAHGPGVSRMYYEDKMHLDKHYPLGDLIWLDRERCIQCARCVRFQDEIVGDDVLAFHERGRRLQIITNSDPGFDTYFSGNTTDICPVGALTTGDFRFGARPWELTEVPSISPWDAAGENISLSTRIDRDFGGRTMIKRVMPRQNEFVNEIWISDKTRFGHHFTRSDARLTKPLVNGSERNWDNVLASVADVLKSADGDIAAIAGGMASNEDAWELAQLADGLGTERLGTWPVSHTGADLVAQVGLPNGSNLSNLGKGDAVLIIASDLEEEVPMWRLRLKQAQDRGAYLVVANTRLTKMGDFATDTWAEDNRDVEGVEIRYNVGEAVQVMENLKKDHEDIAKRLADATNLVIVTGAEGLTLDAHRALVQSAANFLIDTDHAGKENSGLLVPIPGANAMGLYYLGYTPEVTQDIMMNPPKVLVTLDADILADDPFASEWLSKVETIINLTMFPQATVSDTVYTLPIQSFAERDGTFTNGERRVQRFYTAQGPIGEALPAWKALAEVRELLGQGRAKLSAAAVMLEISKHVEAFEGMRYKALGQIVRQFPDVGGEDKYYGGTAYQNKGGVGMQIPLTGTPKTSDVKAPSAQAPSGKEWWIVPTTRLYNHDPKFAPTALVQARVATPFALLNTADADTLGVVTGDSIEVGFGDQSVVVRAEVSDDVSAGAVYLPRQLTDVPTPLVPTTGTLVKTSAPVLQ
ncbi:MAG: molybdopterin-dependent oxidoreductase [Anaerolineae bacterium]